MKNTILTATLALVCMTNASHAVEVPKAGSCPPYPVKPGAEAGGDEDIVTPIFKRGDLIEFGSMSRLENYLPREIWERREIFFFEGQRLEIGPCHRRYPAAPEFEASTEKNRKSITVDKKGNLLGFKGHGLPFPMDSIQDDDPQAGMKWAWNYRYRYLGSGFRGDFRILHVLKRGKRLERYVGEFFLLPMHGVPGVKDDESDVDFWAGGKFTEPSHARGIAWRQRRSLKRLKAGERSDDIFVYTPDERKVRRAANTAVNGIYMPSYTRAQLASGGGLNLPQEGIRTPDASALALTEHWRRGFVGLFAQPNAFEFQFMRVQDVLAPMNAVRPGFPESPGRSYGPSGLSLANDRWDLRRAIVIRGTRKNAEERVAIVTLYIDALTSQPLYYISHRRNRSIYEVGILMSRYSADDALLPNWAGNSQDFGVFVPAAASFFVTGNNSWLRESFGFLSDPPDKKDRRRFTRTSTMQRRGR